MMINHHNYIIKSTSCLHGSGGVFPSFQSTFSFASAMRDFHSLFGIIGGHSYLGLFWKGTLYRSHRYFKYNLSFEVTPVLLKVPSPNRPTILFISSSFNLEIWEFHLVKMVGPKSSKVRSFVRLYNALFPRKRYYH